jgi:tetrahydromethanopterin S-methyltransferase subunit D
VKIAAALAALSLAASPVLAQPSAQPLSLQPAMTRAGAPMQDANGIEGHDVFPVILFVSIIIGGILLATGVIGDNDHPPISP